LKEEVFVPAGMTRSGCWSIDEIVENRAIGYIDPEESKAIGLGAGWRTNVTLQGVRGTSAGGCLSTAGDLFRFARALAEGKLVKPETLDTLLTPRERFPAGGHYAYGFIVNEGRDGKRIYGHGGGFPGVNTELRVYGDGAWTLVVLSNLSGGAGEITSAWDAIVRRIALSK
jgi:CubicO group peptidase (beta-lactamase class C family)